MSEKNLNELKNISKNIVSDLFHTECNDENELRDIPCDPVAWCEEAYDRSKNFLDHVSARRCLDLFEHISDFWIQGYPNTSPFSMLSLADEERYLEFKSEIGLLCKKYNLIFAEKYYENIDKTLFENLDDDENISFNIFARSMSFGDKMDTIFEDMAGDPEVVQCIERRRNKRIGISDHEELKSFYFDMMNEFIMEIPFSSRGDSPSLNTAATIQNALIVNSIAADALNDEKSELSAIKACESLMDTNGFKSIDRAASQNLESSEDISETEGMTMV